MLNMIENYVEKMSGNASGVNPWWATPATHLHPLKTVIHKGQSEGMQDTRDLMRMMIAELNKKQQAGSTTYVDIIGAAIRHGDLSAQFDPRMNQLINLFSGRGDEMVIIV